MSAPKDHIYYSTQLLLDAVGIAQTIDEVFAAMPQIVTAPSLVDHQSISFARDVIAIFPFSKRYKLCFFSGGNNITGDY